VGSDHPHSWIHIDVKGEDGKVVGWMIEGAAPTICTARLNKGFPPARFEIVVDGYQARTHSAKAVGKSVTFADGRGCSSAAGRRVSATRNKRITSTAPRSI